MDCYNGEVEETHNSKLFRSEEELCEQNFKNTYQRHSNGLYTVCLSFKQQDDSNSLGHSRNRAVARLLSLEKCFAKNRTIHKQYIKFMDEYISLGHAQICEPLSTKDVINQITILCHINM